MKPLALAASCLALLAAPVAFAESAAVPEWTALAEVGTVEVLTTDADGAPRRTTVWLAVHEGEGYIRTGGTRWGGNVERDPDVVLVTEGGEYPLRTVRIPQDPTYDAVTQVFRAKYGLVDRVLGVFRSLGGPPKILHLVPREAAPDP